MTQHEQRDSQLTAALSKVLLPSGISIRAWTAADFPAIQQLSTTEEWPTPLLKPQEALAAWQRSWPTLVATDAQTIIGFVRAFTDEAITMYIAELLVAPHYRGRGLGHALLDICHHLYPRVRLDLISTLASQTFYKNHGFRLVGEGLRKSYA